MNRSDTGQYAASHTSYAVVRLEHGCAPLVIETLRSQDDAERYAAVCNRIAGDERCEYVVHEQGEL